MKSIYSIVVWLFLAVVGFAQTSASLVTDMISDTSSGAVAEAQAVMATDVWTLIYFALWALFIGLIVGFIAKRMK